MALQNAEILVAMQKDLGKKLKSLRVDGGASANDLLMQMQSNFLGARCIRPAVIETTSAGAAFMAGLGAGIWKDFSEIKKVWTQDRDFGPRISEKERKDRLKLWQDAVARA
jgi:glycerol kinase